jgi:hypothetical protein
MVNVIPKNDEHPHVHAVDCDCAPKVQWADDQTGEVFFNGPLIVHNAFDCREFSEAITGEGVSDDQGWVVING